MIPRIRPYLTIRDLRHLLPDKARSREELEERFADIAGSRHALLMPYGRSAISFFLKSHECKGREILLPAYTCDVLVGPIIESGNIPVLVDSQHESFSMDEGQIFERLNDKTIAIIPTAMYGISGSLDIYRRLKRKGFYVIGDYALGLFTYLTQKKRNLLETFDLIFFSFGVGKEITFLGGGVLITNDDEIYKKIKRCRDSSCHTSDEGQSCGILLKFMAALCLFHPAIYRFLYFLSEKTHLINRQKGVIQDYLPNDFFLMPTGFQIRLALDRIDNLSSFIDERAETLKYYQRELMKISSKHVTLPPDNTTLTHFPILITEEKRDDLLEFLRRKGIHASPSYRKTLDQLYPNIGARRYPHAESYARTVVLLPLYFNIGREACRQVIDAIRQWAEMAEKNRTKVFRSFPRL